jgi:hypothetical protein
VSTLATLLATLRTDLHDADAQNYRWTDSALERALQRAIAEYGNLVPVDFAADLPAVDGQYTYTLPAGCTVVERVEYPADQGPPAFVAWELRGTELRLLVDLAPSDGNTVRVHGGTAPVVDANGSTIPPADERVILLGAASYALQQWATYAINRVANDGRAQAAADKAAYYARRSFEGELGRLRRERTQALPSRVAIAGYEI